ncbi:hypothetical protein ACFL6U_29195 [Planctomycetota bacterium]
MGKDIAVFPGISDSRVSDSSEQGDISAPAGIGDTRSGNQEPQDRGVSYSQEPLGWDSRACPGIAAAQDIRELTGPGRLEV